MSYEIQQRLIDIMHSKESNLAVSADVTECNALLEIAQEVGDHICILKTHVDMLSDFSIGFLKKLQTIAKQKKFLLFEDRKYADIGHTTSLQFQHSVFCTPQWADLITVQLLAGPGILQALEPLCIQHNCGVLPLLQMSSKDNLLSSDYTQQALGFIEQYTSIVAGAISQEKLQENLLTLTPGIRMHSGTDTVGQQYNTPEHAIKQKGTDIIIVGRGILQNNNPKDAAKIYQQHAWKLYTSIH